MAWATEPIDLQSHQLSLRTIQESEIEEIGIAMHDPTSWNAMNWNENSPEVISAALRKTIAAAKENLCNPCVYRVNGDVAGLSRYMRLEPRNKTLEIGGTWVARKWQKTFVNTQVKYLLLKYAFEQLAAERVEFRVDMRNFVSQMAVLRIGAHFEGKLRNRQIYPNGEVRSGHLYSIIKPEWPIIQTHLEKLLQGERAESKYLASRYVTNRLEMKLYRLSDAGEFLELAARNRSDLVESFPLAANLSNLAQAHEYIAQRAHQAQAGTDFYYGIWLKESGQQIGQFQIKYIDWKTRAADFGFFIDARFRRRGFASELIQFSSQLLLEQFKFKRIYLRTFPENSACLRMAKKNGFSGEGILRRAFHTSLGENKDICYLSIV